MTFLASEYWERRYAEGGHSGSGSQGGLALLKADKINDTIKQLEVDSVVDWGCGDGEILSLLELRGVTYVGVDVSASAIALCARKRPEVALLLWREGHRVFPVADLALSIDILYHFPDDHEYWDYLVNLFDSARQYVLIHTAEQGEPPNEHVRWRPVSDDVARHFPEWKLVDSFPGVNGCEFQLYQYEGEI